MSNPFAESCEASLVNNTQALAGMPSERVMQAVRHLQQQPGAQQLSPGIQQILAAIGQGQDVRASLAKCPARELEAVPPVAEPGYKSAPEGVKEAYKAILNLFVSSFMKYHFKE